MVDFTLIKESLPLLFRGALVTIEIALAGAFIGILIGTVLGIILTSKYRWARWLATLYVTLMRGTPMLIQVTFAPFILPQLGIYLPAFWIAIIVIGLNSGAYVSQIIKTGIRSISKGQIEAGKVLGLSTAQNMRYIILPQAFRLVVPALGNEFITLVKDSSLASVIGVVELTKEGIFIRGRTLDAISTFAAVACIYLIITTVLSIGVNLLEKRMNRHARN